MKPQLSFGLSDEKKTLLDTSGHLLVLGGPGSGKTTIALLKAERIISNGLKKGQHILFLSFARATITRVSQRAHDMITSDTRRSLEINTYHGFAWNILRSHGYLLNSGKPLRLLPPPDAASRLADVDVTKRHKEKERLFTDEGFIHFDLFATLTADLLEKSQRLTQIISSAYPVIILDEFQDTDPNEWRFVQQLAKSSTIIALADLEQRIYEFRGADPARITQFTKAFNPIPFDFEKENNRSNGTDIVDFGNDLLSGVNKSKQYSNVVLKRYAAAYGPAIHMPFKSEVLSAYRRLSKGENPNWSLGILVPSKKFMLAVSDFLGSKQKYSGKAIPGINHEVALEMEGPSLAAIVISRLMEKGKTIEEIQSSLLNNLCEHMRGRGGGGITQANLQLSTALREFASTGKVVGSKRKLVIKDALEIANAIMELNFIGDPVSDWLSVRALLENAASDVVKQVGIDAQYLRLLRKGAVLGTGLGSLWRNNGSYNGASVLVRNALTQEHFAASTTTWKGIHVMTIHKAKGKEFDEVIIYEGIYAGRILRTDPSVTKKEIEQSRYALRVAVTRAMQRATIITPSSDPCSFLF